MEGLGAGLGLLLGGVIVQWLSWRWVFLVNVPIAILAAVLAPGVIPTSPRQRGRLDLTGAASATAGLGLLVFGLSQAANHGWGAALTLGPVIAGSLILASFVWLQSRITAPLMPLWVFRDRNRGGAYLVQTLLGAALFGMFFLGTLFLQHVKGYTPLRAGTAFLPATVAMMAGAALMPKLVTKTGVRPLVAAGTATASAGLLWLSQLTPHSPFLTGVMLPLILLSLGLGVTFVPTTLAAVSGADERALRAGLRRVDHGGSDRRRHRVGDHGHRCRVDHQSPTSRHPNQASADHRLHPRLHRRRDHHRARRSGRTRAPAAAPHQPTAESPPRRPRSETPTHIGSAGSARSSPSSDTPRQLRAARCQPHRSGRPLIAPHRPLWRPGSGNSVP